MRAWRLLRIDGRWTDRGCRLFASKAAGGQEGIAREKDVPIHTSLELDERPRPSMYNIELVARRSRQARRGATVAGGVAALTGSTQDLLKDLLI